MTRDQANEMLASMPSGPDRERFKQATFGLRNVLRMPGEGSAEVNESMLDLLKRRSATAKDT